MSVAVHPFPALPIYDKPNRYERPVAPGFLASIARRAEETNYEMGRIHRLEFQPSRVPTYFNPTFNPYYYEALAEATRNLPLNSKTLKSLNDQMIMNVFQLLEQTLWYYNDNLTNYRYKIKNLYVLLRLYFNDLADEEIKDLIHRYNNLIQEWPVAGALMISEDGQHVLLVKNKFGLSYGPPKGKLLPNESPEEGAIRESGEEVGYNIRPYLRPEWLIARTYHRKPIYLYIIKGVPMNYPFRAQCSNEIVDIKWFPLNEALQQHRGFNIYINRSYPILQQFLQGVPIMNIPDPLPSLRDPA